ncbi:MAG TPA: cyanophycinase [Methylibium sp.]|nr:cyanophycinase [Methylibium sp.]
MTTTPQRSRRACLGLMRGLLVLALTAGFGTLPALAASGGAGTGAKATTSNKNYDYYLTGSAADTQPAAPASRMMVLMGGGIDVDAAFQAMIARAGGSTTAKIDVVIVRASGADGYNPYLYAMAGVDSVETLVIKTRAGADDPAVNAIVAKADVLFIAGGDQWNYIKLWKDSRLETTLEGLAARHVPMGGTSAGLAVLGAVDYSAQNGTVSSADALADPYHRRVTLDRDFLNTLPHLAGTITDPHLVTRDRMGRLVSFMARMIKDGWVTTAAARAIGVDEQTALVVEAATGAAPAATVVGVGAAYLLQPSIAPTTVVARQPLSFPAIGVRKVTAGSGSFPLWGGSPTYHLDAVSGVLTSDQAGGASIY